MYMYILILAKNHLRVSFVLFSDGITVLKELGRLIALTTGDICVTAHLF